MYRVSTQGVDERMINVHYYYYDGDDDDGDDDDGDDDDVYLQGHKRFSTKSNE